MNNRKSFPLHLSLNIVLLVVLLFTPSSSSAITTSCPDNYCLYLPYVNSPKPVKIMQTKATRSISGQFRVIGNVATTLDLPVEEVILELKGYDLRTGLLGVITGTTVLTATLPGQLNPFDMNTPFDAGEVYSYSVEVVGWNSNPDTILCAPTLVATDTHWSFTGIDVVTTIRNDSPQTLSNVQSIAWALDTASGLSLIPVTDSLLPGETMTFASFVYGYYPLGYIPPIWVAVQGITEP